MSSASACRYLDHEARALLTRLNRLKPFALSETMVPAANVAPVAQRAIDRHLAEGRRELRRQVHAFIASLSPAHAPGIDPADAQRRFALLRLHFNAALTQFDVFSDALSQRGDRDHGVWMAGLDALAADALALPEAYDAPPVVCYLDRGIGAAIRRARTRLPGGGANPVAIVRVPRERMVGSGIASSLVHEVGHQAAALLDLVKPLRAELRARDEASMDPGRSPWRWWDRWISEIVADFWSVMRLGLAATGGLMAVLSLPRAFVFRIGGDDPHPTPWIRVLLSAAIGEALYPDPQWARSAQLWRTLYPLARAEGAAFQLVQLEAAIPSFVALLLAHRPPRLQGRALADLARPDRIGATGLRRDLERWRDDPAGMFGVGPCRACAAIGQARQRGELAAEVESQWMAALLTHWALRNALGDGAARSPPH